MPSPAGSGTSRPAVRARLPSFAARARPGWPSGTPSVTDVALLLDRLRAQPVRVDVLRGLGGLVAEDVRVAVDQLVDEAARHVVDGEGLFGVFLRDAGVEDDLEQDVAEFLAQLVRSPSSIASTSSYASSMAYLARPLWVCCEVQGHSRADPVHDLDQVQEAGAGQVVRAGEQLQVRHGHPARAAEPGQAVGQPAGRPRRRPGPRPCGRPRRRRPAPRRWVPRARRVMPASRRYGSCGWSGSAHEHPVGGVQRLPGRPGQQAGRDPVAGGEQDDTAGGGRGRAGVAGGGRGRAGGFSVHPANLPAVSRGQAPASSDRPKRPAQAPASGSCGADSVTWVIHGVL